MIKAETTDGYNHRVTTDLTDSEIEAITLQLRADLATEIGDFGPRLPLDELSNYLKGLGVVVTENYLGKDVVGTIRFTEPGAHIIIDAPTALSPLASFSFAHEIGHFMLHRHEGSEMVTLRRDLSAAQSKTEWQANRFAVHLLMPSDIVAREFRRRYGTISRAFSELSPSAKERWNNRRDYSRFLAVRGQSSSLASLATAFGVSGATMAIRLEELCLV